MFVFEIMTPGTWLDYEDRNWAWEIENQLSHLKSQFFEANAALNLFTQAGSRRASFIDRERWEQDSKRRRELEQLVQAEKGGRLSWDEMDSIRLEAEVRFKREEWARGRVPRELENSTPFLFARAFLYALDTFDRLLEVLSKTEGVPEELSNIHKEVSISFPSLRGVRNSAHHLEDRARKLGVGGKPIELKPINNEFVSAPHGGILMISCLNGSKYGATMADGHYGEVDVSPESMEKIMLILQSALCTFRWKGPARYEPSV